MFQIGRIAWKTSKQCFADRYTPFTGDTQRNETYLVDHLLGYSIIVSNYMSVFNLTQTWIFATVSSNNVKRHLDVTLHNREC